MPKSIATAAAAAAAAATLAGAASAADPAMDHMQQKGAYIYTFLHVDPEHIDDYMVVLKSTVVPAEEDLKLRGLIDSYSIQIAQKVAGEGANLMTIEHWPTLERLDPDKLRDEAFQSQSNKFLPKSDEAAVAAARAQYRKILGQGVWTVVEFK